MSLEIFTWSKTAWTVSTGIWLCASVNMNMALQFAIRLKTLSTVWTQIWSSISVHSKFMSLQVAGDEKTFVTQWADVPLFLSRVDSYMHSQLSVCLKHLSTVSTEIWPLVGVYWKFMSLQVAGQVEAFVTQWTDIRTSFSRVDSHMHSQMCRLSKVLVTHKTSVWFLLTVNSAVLYKVTRNCKLFPTNSTYERFLSWMTSPVICQASVAWEALITFCALVFTSVNIHMTAQCILRYELFLAFSASIIIFPGV